MRSIDLVAAYLQGSFEEGEVVYTELPKGYPEYDVHGQPRVARIEKPIYGIQQAGRRLQRRMVALRRARRSSGRHAAGLAPAPLPWQEGLAAGYSHLDRRDARQETPLAVAAQHASLARTSCA